MYNLFQFDVRVVTTEKALHFFDKAAISSVLLYEDKHEWEVGLFQSLEKNSNSDIL